MKADDIFKDEYTRIMKQAMVEKGVTLRALANKTGYSYEGVRQITKGNGSYWGVFKVCRALNINIKTLVDVPAE